MAEKKQVPWYDHAASAIPAVLDTANVLSQHALINTTKKIKDQARLVEVPEFTPAVRTPHGLTAEQKAAAENKVLSTGIGYKGSDFGKTLVARNMRASRVAEGMDKIASADAGLYRQSYDKAFDDENIRRKAKHDTAMKVAEGQQQLQDFKLKNKVDMITSKRQLLSNLFEGLKKTGDQNRAFAASSLEARRQGMITSLQSDVQHYAGMLASATDAFEKKTLTAKYNTAQDQLRALLAKPLPSLKNLNAIDYTGTDYFKKGGRISLIPRK